jgi:hypothetical protein
MTGRIGILTVLGLVAFCPAVAQTPRLVKVAVEFHQSSRDSREGVQGSGGVIITERGGVRPRGGLGVEDTRTQTRQSTGIFTLVQDGGESTLSVATQIPVPQVAYFQNYATGAGYIAQGVNFRDVGTALKVRASVLPADQVRVRVTPTISYFSPTGAGAVEFTESTTELIVTSGRPVQFIGATSSAETLLRQILGVRREQSGRETQAVLTATIQ